MTTRRNQGNHWESVAESFLQKQGLKTLTRNYNCRMGEIDLILEDGDCLVFAEIRYRKSSNFGTGAETVTRAKQMRIIQTASRYLQYHEQRVTQPCRFDVVSMGKVNGELEINWIRNAFTST